MKSYFFTVLAFLIILINVKADISKQVEAMPQWFLIPPVYEGFTYTAGYGEGPNIKIARELALTYALNALAIEKYSQRAELLKTDEATENSPETDHQSMMKEVIADVEASEIYIREVEDQCNDELFISYVLIEHPYNDNYSKNKELQNTNICKEIEDIPQWYNTPIIFDKNNYLIKYFSGHGSHTEEETAINLALVDALKFMSQYLDLSYSSITKKVGDSDEPRLSKFSSFSKNIINNRFASFVYKHSVIQQDFSDQNISTNFSEEIDEREDGIYYKLNYKHMSRGKANESGAPMGIDETLSIVGKVWKEYFLDFKDNKIEKLNVNKSSNGEYVAYVMLKLDFEDIIKKEQEMLEAVKDSDAFKELEEEIKKVLEENE